MNQAYLFKLFTKSNHITSGNRRLFTVIFFVSESSNLMISAEGTKIAHKLYSCDVRQLKGNVCPGVVFKLSVDED
jgi:hypothetical protein